MAATQALPEARLLVVDDEPNILELLSGSPAVRRLRRRDGGGGAEAVRAAQRHGPTSSCST